MAEVAEESEHVWSHKQRIALFLSAMRHYALWLGEQGFPLDYLALEAPDNEQCLGRELAKTLRREGPAEVVCVEAGDWRVQQMLEKACADAGVPLRWLDDTHFLATRADFAAYARGKKQLRMEFFYREMRRKHSVLLERGEPVGGAWNFDAENRKSFGKEGPAKLPEARRFAPDAITQEVLELVERRFPKHPGSLASFAWPVTPEEAEIALDDFIRRRLPVFGDHQDAMWTGEAFLAHSLLSSSLNLKLLSPLRAVRAAEDAYHDGRAPLAAVEGFVRQILGWREYVRGIYFLKMPAYLESNELDAREPLPAFYWHGRTDKACLSEVLKQTLEHGYSHHIQRLMVTGLYALLLGVEPRRVHEWYLAIYVDAVEWVELPNTLGMSQYADGGYLASKPYVATGKYIERMSPYCKGCRYDPGQSTGPKACPFTTLYWDFLLRHEARLRSNVRMSLQVKNLARLDAGKRREIREAAESLRAAEALGKQI